MRTIVLAVMFLSSMAPIGQPAVAAPCAPSDMPHEPVPVGPFACPGVRPGAKLVTSLGGCSIGFLFRDGNGERYASSAGHCFLPPRVAERVWTSGDGPVASEADGRRIGQAVYAIKDPGAGGRDFGLVKLDVSVQADAAVCYWGGPTGYYTALAPLGSMQEYKFFGQAVGIAEVAPARTGIGFGTPDPDWVLAYGVHFRGDSGAPFMTADGRAVGLLKGGGVGTGENRDSGTIFVPRLAPGLARAQQVLGVTLTLLTAPLAR